MIRTHGAKKGEVPSGRLPEPALLRLQKGTKEHAPARAGVKSPAQNVCVRHTRVWHDTHKHRTIWGVDLDTLDLPSQCQLVFPDEHNKTKFEAVIRPDEGFYQSGQFRFSVNVPSTYPHDPPKVRCLQTIFHPNIDTNGSVCLNVLGVSWNPVMTIYSVVIGLLDLFYNPQVDDPLNKEAALLLKTNPDAFARKVRLTMKGVSSDATPYSNTLF